MKKRKLVKSDFTFSELEAIQKEYDLLVDAGRTINYIYQNQESELIHECLQQALDSLAVAHKFYCIVLGLTCEELVK